MAALTKDEVLFLKSQGLTADDVFVAIGMPSAQAKAAVRAAGKKVMLGSSCDAAGHRLRTRSGHCCQCDTKKLAFNNRHNDEGYVYVAGSLSAKLVKIGCCKDIDQRERNLRHQGYGGISDWRILFHVKVPFMGKTEHAALKRLQAYRIERTFMKDGKPNVAGEMLACPFSRALASLRQEVGKSGGREVMSLDHRRYEFQT